MNRDIGKSGHPNQFLLLLVKFLISSPVAAFAIKSDGPMTRFPDDPIWK